MRVILGAVQRPCNVIAIRKRLGECGMPGIKTREFIKDHRPRPSIDQQMMRAPQHLPFVVMESNESYPQQLTGGKIEIPGAIGLDGLREKFQSVGVCGMRSEEHTSELQSRLHL